METDKFEELIDEVGRETVEFLCGQIRLNTPSLSNQEQFEFMHKVTLGIYINSINSISKTFHQSAVVVHNLYDFDKFFNEVDENRKKDKDSDEKKVKDVMEIIAKIEKEMNNES